MHNVRDEIIKDIANLPQQPLYLSAFVNHLLDGTQRNVLRAYRFHVQLHIEGLENFMEEDLQRHCAMIANDVSIIINEFNKYWCDHYEWLMTPRSACIMWKFDANLDIVGTIFRRQRRVLLDEHVMAFLMGGHPRLSLLSAVPEPIISRIAGEPGIMKQIVMMSFFFGNAAALTLP